MTVTQLNRDREIRVFLSSTFRDMDAERNHLLKLVFPKIRAACFSRQVGFTEIDLRWGITDEEAKNGNTVEICLSEIDRCRNFPPFFIGFLGERYGWVPNIDELDAYWKNRADSPYLKSINQAVMRRISVTELEMELAVLNEGAVEKIAGRALFLLRDKALTDQLYFEHTGLKPNDQDQRYYDLSNGLLDVLKSRIRATPYLGIDGYNSIEEFGSVIEKFLMSQLENFFPLNQVPSATERIKDVHLRFRFHRLQNFVPRVEIRQLFLRAMKERIETPALGPILLSGPSGYGKSALMADLAQTLELSQSVIHWYVIEHYVGADEIISIGGWINRLLKTLHPEIEDLSGAIPSDIKDQMQELSSWLSMSARRIEAKNGDGIPVRFALILDAVDQFIDQGKDIDSLTSELLGPDGILVLSAAESTAAREVAKELTIIEIPVFNAELKNNLIHNTLQRYRKTLPTELILKLSNASQADSPLFLSLALEGLRLDAHHEDLFEHIEKIVRSPNAAHLFLHCFLLDSDYGRPENPTLGAQFMALIGASRNGLSESELSEILALPSDPIPEGGVNPKLPQIYLSRLLTAFQPFLLNKQGYRSPMHRIFGTTALDYQGDLLVRRYLYGFFKRKYSKNVSNIDQRSATEEIYQLIRLLDLNKNQKKVIKKNIRNFLSNLNLILQIEDLAIQSELLKSLNKKDFRFIYRKWKKFIFSRDLYNIDQSVISSICGYGDWLGDNGFFNHSIKILNNMRNWQLLSTHDRGELSNTTNCLANVYCDIGDFNKAKSLYEENLILDIKLSGEDSEKTAYDYNNLGLLLSDMGNYKESETYLFKALLIREKIIGCDHRYTASTLNNIACMFSCMGRTDDAIEYQIKSLNIQNKILDSKHKEIADSLSNLGFLMMRQGDYSSSEKNFRLAITIDEKRVGREHFLTAIGIGGLGRLLYKIGEIKEAITVSSEAYSIHYKTLGLTHSYTKISLSHYIESLLAGHEIDNANIVCANVINEANLKYKEELSAIIKVIAYAYKGFSLYLENTKSFFEKLLRLEERNKGFYHKDTIEILLELALIDSNDLEKSERLLKDYISRVKTLSGTNSLDVAKAYKSLGELFKLKGQINNARNYFVKVLNIYEEQLGLDHELTVSIRNCIYELN